MIPCSILVSIYIYIYLQLNSLIFFSLSLLIIIALLPSSIHIYISIHFEGSPMQPTFGGRQPARWVEFQLGGIALANWFFWRRLSSLAIQMSSDLILVHCLLMLVIICCQFCSLVLVFCRSIGIQEGIALQSSSLLVSLSGACLHLIVSTSHNMCHLHTRNRNENVSILAAIGSSCVCTCKLSHVSAAPPFLLILIHCHFGSQIDNNSTEWLHPLLLLPVNEHWPGFGTADMSLQSAKLSRGTMAQLKAARYYYHCLLLLVSAIIISGWLIRVPMTSCKAEIIMSYSLVLWCSSPESIGRMIVSRHCSPSWSHCSKDR